MNDIIGNGLNIIHPALKVGDVDAGNYTDILADGTIRLNGTAKTWTDFSVPLTRDKQGQSSKPDYDFTNLGLLFPENDESEIVYINLQMLHQKALQSAIEIHVHYIQSSADQPIFELQYKFYNNSAAVPGSWTTIDTHLVKGKYTYTSGSILQKGIFPSIAAPANETLSANIDIKLYRQTGDGVAGDILTKYIDIHFQIDSLGSAQEYIK